MSVKECTEIVWNDIICDRSIKTTGAGRSSENIPQCNATMRELRHAACVIERHLRNFARQNLPECILGVGVVLASLDGDPARKPA